MINRYLGPNINFDLSAYGYSSRVMLIFVQAVLSRSVISGRKLVSGFGSDCTTRKWVFYVALVRVSLALVARVCKCMELGSGFAVTPCEISLREKVWFREEPVAQHFEQCVLCSSSGDCRYSDHPGGYVGCEERWSVENLPARCGR